MPEYTLAYLGPEASFSHMAASAFASSRETALLACADLEDVYHAVETGFADGGIVPVENSYEGSVHEVLDLLIQKENIYISGEYILPIQHALLVKRGVKKEEIKQLVSHPQALAQCRQYLMKNFPGIPRQQVSSTAEAACQAACHSEAIAAIGNPEAAKLYNLEILEESINDQSNNATRFLLLSPSLDLAEEGIKTSLLLHIQDRPGALYEILGAFARRNINLTRIESRPTKHQLGQYYFFIDIDGNLQDAVIQAALQEIPRHTLMLRILGSYKPACQQSIPPADGAL